MKKITLATLKAAHAWRCRTGSAAFRKMFPQGVVPSESLCVLLMESEHGHTFLFWAACNLLKGKWYEAFWAAERQHALPYVAADNENVTEAEKTYRIACAREFAKQWARQTKKRVK